MGVGKGCGAAILGFAEETEYGNWVTPTKFVRLISDGVQAEEELVSSESIYACYPDKDDIIQGKQGVGGDVATEFRYEGMELLLEHGLGSVSTAEVASFVVNDSNKYFDFTTDGGVSEITATLATGTYIAGATEATANSLCKTLHDAIVAAGEVGTNYEVDFSSVTKKFTIKKSGGADVLEILWKTGTHGSSGTNTNCAALMGYATTADSGPLDSAGQTSDTAVVTVYDHTFTMAAELPTGLSLEIDRDISAFKYGGCKINTLGFELEHGGFLKMTLGIIGANSDTGTATTPTLASGALANFSQGVLTYDSDEKEITNFSLSIENNLKDDRYAIQSTSPRQRREPLRASRYVITGSFTIEFEDETIYDDFMAATTQALTMVFTGNEMKTNFNYSLTFSLPYVRITPNGTPMISDYGIINQEVPFQAYADGGHNALSITLRNTIASI